MVSQRHALVMGGTRGIGRDLVETFSEEGYLTSVIARHLPKGPEKAASGVQYWSADLTHPAQITKTLSQIIHQRGPLNYLIFLQRYRAAGEKWSEEIQTTLTATRFIIEQLTNKFDPREAAIVLAGSMGGRLVVHDVPLAYQVSKAALLHMARYYAVRLGPKAIRVNSVSPGTVLKEESKQYFLRNRPLHHFYKRMIPLNRMGTAREVAQVIAFLCNSKSSFVTGQDIVVDGGLGVQWQESLALKLAFKGRKDYDS